MANVKLSAIAASGSNLVGADTLVGVHSGTTDLLFSGTQVAALVNASPTITGHATIEGVTATGATGTGKFVFDGTPTLVTPVLGVATGTSIALGGATLGSNALAITGHVLVEGVTSTGATGTGKFVFDTAPTVGVLTATSFNKMAITAPSSSSTLAVADGKTATISNTITFAGTDSTTMTFPPASASIGYLNVPINGQNAGYTCVAADAGKCIVMQTAGTFTIPAEGSVNYALGTVLTFVNNTTSSTIPITSDTMTLAGTATTGTRTLAAHGIATAIKIASVTWLISGTGLT